MNIKTHPINLVKTQALVDPVTFYGFFFRVEEGQGYRKILRFSLKAFYPKYAEKKTSQEYLAELVFQQMDAGTVTAETVLNSLIYTYDVTGQRFLFFQYLSETGNLRVPENIINGMLDDVTEKPSILGIENPIYVTRAYTDGSYKIEAYNQQYAEIQPLVCWVGYIQPCTPDPENQGEFLENGSIEILFSEATNPTASIDGGAFEPITSPHLFENLAQGTHTVTVTDDVQSVIFTITV